jgi:electron transfer flavoprotein alpha subunit
MPSRAGSGIKGKVEDQILPYGVDKLFVFDAEGSSPIPRHHIPTSW